MLFDTFQAANASIELRRLLDAGIISIMDWRVQYQMLSWQIE